MQFQEKTFGKISIANRYEKKEHIDLKSAGAFTPIVKKEPQNGFVAGAESTGRGELNTVYGNPNAGSFYPLPENQLSIEETADCSDSTNSLLP